MKISFIISEPDCFSVTMGSLHASLTIVYVLQHQNIQCRANIWPVNLFYVTDCLGCCLLKGGECIVVHLLLVAALLDIEVVFGRY